MFQDNMGQAIKHVQGASGCLLIGFDGIPIASVYPETDRVDETRLIELAVELAAMLGKLNRIADENQTPRIDSLSLSGGGVTALARVIQREYLLILALSPQADLKRGQQMLKLLTPWVEGEM